MVKIKQEGKNIIFESCGNFDLLKTLECGQCFRWSRQEDGSYVGVVNGDVIRLKQDGDKLIFKNLGSNAVNKMILYFDLKREYEKIDESISDLYFIKEACQYSKGIRILKQDPWETLISYIISQNNNIPRIKKIIETLCKNFGKKIDENNFAFPSVNDLIGVSVEDLGVLRCGFRDKYIIDAIEKIKNKEIILEDVYKMETPRARELLMSIKGVGNKVADCVLLYGFGKTDCFPVDTWIKKAMIKYFPGGLPDIESEYLGVVQQYIFYYIRYLETKNR